MTVSAYYSRRPRVVHLSVAAPVVEAAGLDPATLRVCADPNNLPFSNERGEGFENHIAQAIARDLHRSVSYYWHPQRRGFIRATLLAGMCDVVMGVPASLEMAQVTRPYYRSSYVFVSRRDRRLSLMSFDDPRLRALRIAIPITGDDYENPPPARALAVRRIFDNVHGYPVYGDYSKPHPSSGAVDAVRRGEVDVAIAWGPIAGFAAQQPGAPLHLSPVPARDGSLPFAFDIADGGSPGRHGAGGRSRRDARGSCSRDPAHSQLLRCPACEPRRESWRMNTPRVLLTLVGASLVVSARVLPPREERSERHLSAAADHRSGRPASRTRPGDPWSH